MATKVQKKVKIPKAFTCLFLLTYIFLLFLNFFLYFYRQIFMCFLLVCNVVNDSFAELNDTFTLVNDTFAFLNDTFRTLNDTFVYLCFYGRVGGNGK